jgi:hypothetical protein
MQYRCGTCAAAEEVHSGAVFSKQLVVIAYAIHDLHDTA